MNEEPRNWDKELANIDKAIARQPAPTAPAGWHRGKAGSSAFASFRRTDLVLDCPRSHSRHSAAALAQR